MPSPRWEYCAKCLPKLELVNALAAIQRLTPPNTDAPKPSLHRENEFQKASGGYPGVNARDNRLHHNLRI
jgi:hypothetical protein